MVSGAQSRTDKFPIGYRRVLDGQQIPMVSFRQSQLRAILLGLVIADALSQGQLAWPFEGEQSLTKLPQRPSAGAIADDRWCQEIARQCQTEPATPQGIPAPPTPPDEFVAETAGLTPMLIQLPWILAQLDTPLPLADAVSTAWHTCLSACLQRDERSLRALQHHFDGGTAGLPPVIQDGLSRAIATVLTAEGDFQLAIGQSLYESPAIVGLPVLTGILSAGWGDLPSLPSRYRHWLGQPSAKLQSWLRQRWQMSNGTTLDGWATALWRCWLGMETGARQSLPIAVMPIAADRLPPSRSPRSSRL